MLRQMFSTLFMLPRHNAAAIWRRDAMPYADIIFASGAMPCHYAFRFILIFRCRFLATIAAMLYAMRPLRHAALMIRLIISPRRRHFAIMRLRHCRHFTPRALLILRHDITPCRYDVTLFITFFTLIADTRFLTTIFHARLLRWLLLLALRHVTIPALFH